MIEIMRHDKARPVFEEISQERLLAIRFTIDGQRFDVTETGDCLAIRSLDSYITVVPESANKIVIAGS